MARKAADLVAGLYNIAFETDSAGKFYAIAPGDEGADFDTESPVHVHKGRPDELQVCVFRCYDGLDVVLLLTQVLNSGGYNLLTISSPLGDILSPQPMIQ